MKPDAPVMAPASPGGARRAISDNCTPFQPIPVAPKHEFGLDRPLALQYATYVRQVLKGDLGISLTTHEPVLDEFLTLFPATIELAFFAMVLAVCIGLPAGILAALKRNTVADYAVMSCLPFRSSGYRCRHS